MRIPAWSRRTWIALAVCVLGVAVMAVAVLSGSGGSADGRANDAPDLPSGTQTNLTPLPLEGSTDAEKNEAALKKLFKDRADPFASGTSYGAPAKHKITVEISSRGYSVFGVRYRDKKDVDKRVVSGPYSVTRTVFGAFPIVQAGVQLSYAGGRASCRITIDGVLTATASTDKPYGLAVCTA
jgi:hypothetical protein